MWTSFTLYFKSQGLFFDPLHTQKTLLYNSHMFHNCVHNSQFSSWIVFNVVMFNILFIVLFSFVKSHNFDQIDLVSTQCCLEE